MFVNCRWSWINYNKIRWAIYLRYTLTVKNKKVYKNLFDRYTVYHYDSVLNVDE